MAEKIPRRFRFYTIEATQRLEDEEVPEELSFASVARVLRSEEIPLVYRERNEEWRIEIESISDDDNEVFGVFTRLRTQALPEDLDED